MHSCECPIGFSRSSVRFFAIEATRWQERNKMAIETEVDGAIVHVKYEDLVRFPEETVRFLCYRIGMPYEPSMLEAESRQGDPLSVHAHHRRLDKPIDSQRADVWRTTLPDWACYIIEQCASPLIWRLGYHPSRKRPLFPITVLLRLGLFWWKKSIRYGRQR